jgi:hypothetical protein
MPTLPIVEHLDVLEQTLPCLLLCSVVFVINQFGFQCAEEALCNGIVMTFAFSAHAADQTISPERLLSSAYQSLVCEFSKLTILSVCFHQ